MTQQHRSWVPDFYVKLFFGFLESFYGFFSSFFRFMQKDLSNPLCFCRKPIFLGNLLEILRRMLAPRTNEIVGKLLAFMHVAADLAYPFMLAALRFFFRLGRSGLRLDIALIILVRHRFFTGQLLCLRYLGNEQRMRTVIVIIDHFTAQNRVRIRRQIIESVFARLVPAPFEFTLPIL